MNLEPCVGCRRHVSTSETQCPFCSAQLTPGASRSLLSGRVPRAAVFAGATLLAAAGCGSKKPTNTVGNQGSGSATEGSAMTATPDAAPETVDKPIDHPQPMPYGAPPVRRRVV